MARKIVLFLSASSRDEVPQGYLCPDGASVQGTQTNEAPVKYLLQAYPDVSEVICVVTDEAKTVAWTGFCELLHTMYPTVAVTEIPYRDGEDFNTGPLLKILQCLESGDDLLLETTGGFRNTIMHLLLLSRILSYKGVRTECAVYANWQKKSVEDLSHLIGLFDLVGGMQELTSFGSVRTLRTYYGAPARTDAIEELLVSMEKLTEAITLCRANQLDQAMNRFSAALVAAERDSCDPLLQQLLPVFHEKFGEEMSILDLIVWCVENDMLQQALTIYTERVPELIMQYIEEPSGGVTLRQAAYEKDAAVRFTRGFLMLSCNTKGHPKNSPIKSLRNYINGRSQDLMKYVFGNGSVYIWPNVRVGLDNLKEVLLATYLQDNESFESAWREKIARGKSFLKELDDENWSYNLETMLSYGMNDRNLCLLFGGTAYTITIQNLQALLQDSGYRLNCSVREIQELSRDYLYIKALRNMANHANSEETVDQDLLMSYLVKFGYTPLSEVTMVEVKDAILAGVERLRMIAKEGDTL